MDSNNLSTKVLVVDDIVDNIHLLTFELEDEGFIISSAQSGLECLEKANQDKPHIILLDIRMPGISGIETLIQLKKDPETTDIPIIMVSANNDEEHIVKALDLGAHDFVSKPVEFQILLARMNSALRLSQALEKLEQLNEELQRLADTDPLTNSFNRRHFFSLSNSEFLRAKRHERSLSAIMIDVDHFKKTNDRYGHAGGDKILKILAQHCRGMLRDSDIFGRIGGEEFAICCPETSFEGALAIAEKLRVSLQEKDIVLDSESVNITISLGVAVLRDSDHTFKQLLNGADIALYKAKNEGRNQTSCRPT